MKRRQFFTATAALPLSIIAPKALATKKPVVTTWININVRGVGERGPDIFFPRSSK